MKTNGKEEQRQAILDDVKNWPRKMLVQFARNELRVRMRTESATELTIRDKAFKAYQNTCE